MPTTIIRLYSLDLILYLGTVIDYQHFMRSRFVSLLILMVVSVSFGSAQFNDYKYIIVPKRFDSFKKENLYQTSTTVKYLLAQKGFNAVYDDALQDLGKDRCLRLRVDLEDNSSLFLTKVTLVFKDCQSVEIFRTVEGKSKIKEYKSAYTDAIRKAFVSLEGITYNYRPKAQEQEKEEVFTISFKDDVKTLEKGQNAAVVKQEATTENQTFKSMAPRPSPYAETGDSPQNGIVEVLYAQPLENGYQLVDDSPKIRYRLVSTSVENLFLVHEGDGTGIVYHKNGNWWLEYAENGFTKVTKLSIKF